MPPTTLIRSLNAVRRKVRMLAFASGTGAAIASAVVLLIAIVLLDWQFGLDKFPRLLLMIAAGGCLLYVLWHWLVKPLMARLNIGDVAGRLEGAFPQFDDRLRSTVNFVQGEVPGSDAMKQRVVSEANALAKNVNLQHVIDRRPMYLRTLAGLGAALALAGVIFYGAGAQHVDAMRETASHAHLAVLVPHRSAAFETWFGVATDRLMLGNAQWPKSVEIAVDSTLPTHVAVGEMIPVRVHLTKGDKPSRNVNVYYRYDQGQWQQISVKRTDDGTYATTLKATLAQGHASANLQVRVEAGDNEVSLNPVEVVPPLQIVRVEAEMTPPQYLQPSPAPTVNLSEGKALAVYGSKVGLRISFNKPIVESSVHLDPPTVDGAPAQHSWEFPKFAWDHSGNSSVAVARFSAEAIEAVTPAPTPSGQTTFRFKVKATDTDGLQNAGDEYQFTIIEDQLPSVELTQPKEWSKEDRTAVAGFDIKAQAKDDYGIVGARLVVQRIKREAADPAAASTQPPASAPWIINLVNPANNVPVVAPGASFESAEGTLDLKSFNIGYHLELSTLQGADLKKGDVLEYHMEVKDNFLLEDKTNPALKKEHPWVSSGKVTITIITMEEFMNRAGLATAQVQQQIKYQALSEARQNAETKTLKQGVNARKKFDPADLAQTTRLANEQTETQSQTNQQADRLKAIAQEMKENKAPEDGLQKTVKEVEADLRQTANAEMREARNNLDAAKDPQKLGDPKLDEPRTGDQKPADSKNGEQKSSEQKSGEPKAGEQKAADAKSGEQKSGEQKSGESKTADAKSGEQKPGEQKSSEQKAGEAKAGDQKSGEQKPAEAKAGDQKSGEQKSGQAKAGEQKSGEQKSGQAKAGEQKSGEQKSGQAKAGEQKSGEQKSGQAKAGDQKSGEQKSGQAKAGDSKSGEQKSGEPKSGQAQAKAQPKSDEPKLSPEEAKELAKRDLAMAKASDSQIAAEEKLRRAMNKIGNIDGLQGAIDTLKKIRDEQEKIEKGFQANNKDNAGKKPEELSKPDKAKNDKAAEEQKNLAEQLERSLDNIEKATQPMSKSDPAAQSMKDAVKMGKAKGLSGKQKQAADDMEQNQQAKAQKGQKEVELGLDQMIDKLKEAQRRQLEELAKKLAQMQQLVNELVRLQSGHNIDNLLIQGGPKRLQQLDAKELEALLLMAGREADKLAPAPHLDDLTALQEQTYTNTVNLSKQAESLPDAGPATKLTQAAGHMERAIVHLRASRVLDAYQPPQVDALVALLEAKKDIDAQAKKAQQDSQDQDADTIKELYVKLLAKQKEIGKAIDDIDAATKANKGDTPRELAVKLGQLPGTQGEQIKTAEKIGEDLKKLGSVVYDWANHDIMNSMGRIKDNLAKPDTGKTTQVAEKDAEEQIQAMIDSLIQTKRESQFASRGGDGKGGKGKPKPKMPGEAELRLLKKNQEAVNTRTKNQGDIVAKKLAPDKEELLVVGNRQKEIRDVLGNLVKKNGGGSIDPPPDTKDDVAANATKEQLRNKDLLDDLLNDKPVEQAKVDKTVKATGDKMWHAGVRIAEKNDPGPITQEIQKQIVLDLDDFIKMAQAQQANSKPKPGEGKPEQVAEGKPQPGDPQPGAKKPGQKQDTGTTAAEESTLNKGSDPNADLSAEIKNAFNEWGKLSARNRQNVQSIGGEEVLGKYQRIVEDYYLSLAKQGSKHEAAH